MDPLTHALASFAVSRAVIPRAPRLAVVTVVLVGTASDLDLLTSFAGPAAYFAAQRALTHSVLAAILLPLSLSAALYFPSLHKGQPRISFPRLLYVAALASSLHLALDLCNADGVALLGPFDRQRYSLDLAAQIDPWILTLLLVAILLPALLGLVTEEIGARAKVPRGRTAALLALLAAFVYVGVRALLHGNAIAALQARTYHGQSAQRAAALPDTVSPFTWHGVVETESALHQVLVIVGPGATFDPEASVTLYKPEPSPMLETARTTEAAQKFLRTAGFPKATVTRIDDRYRVELRDLRYTATGERRIAVAVLVEVSPDRRVLREEFVWERDLRNR